MSTPTVSAVLDKPSYSPGERMTLTVTYADADTTSYPVVVTVTDAAGGQGSATVNVVRNDQLTISVSDPTGKVWVPQSNDGARAVYATTA